MKSAGAVSGEYGGCSMVFVECLVTKFLHNDGPV
jgi:hypothetical protein